MNRVPSRNGPAPALFLLPMIALAVSPAAVADPGQHWASLCTSDGARLVAVEDVDDIPGQRPEDRGSGICAHATCPRETRPGAKGRVRL